MIYFSNLEQDDSVR
jgi:hypothetical protein